MCNAGFCQAFSRRDRGSATELGASQNGALGKNAWSPPVGRVLAAHGLVDPVPMRRDLLQGAGRGQCSFLQPGFTFSTCSSRSSSSLTLSPRALTSCAIVSKLPGPRDDPLRSSHRQVSHRRDADTHRRRGHTARGAPGDRHLLRSFLQRNSSPRNSNARLRERALARGRSSGRHPTPASMNRERVLPHGGSSLLLTRVVRGSLPPDTELRRLRVGLGRVGRALGRYIRFGDAPRHR